MLGAIIGDLAGSIYEFSQVKSSGPVKMKNIIEDNAFFSDDTILTVAVADAILTGKDYESKLKEYALKYDNYVPNFKSYFKTMFSPNFSRWAKGETNGESEGNGAMMRVSAVGNYFNDKDEVIKNARLATIPSHNSASAIDCATKVALFIFYAKQGLSKSEIIHMLGIEIKKPAVKSFNYLCKDTIDICMYSVIMAESFEDAIRISISFGGDTDTNACITGSMAENLFGISEDLKKMALSKLPRNFVDVIEKFYKKRG